MKQTKSALNGKNINLTGDNTIITSNNFNVDENGNMSCTNANINGTITSNNANITGGKIDLSANVGETRMKVYYPNSNISTNIQPNGVIVHSDNETDYMVDIGYATGDEDTGYVRVVNSGVTSETNIDSYGIVTPTVNQTSLAEKKKNFEKMQDNALETVKQIDIYKYNLKTEQDTDKKHIGFVIGDNYNYSKEVTSLDNKGVDNYSFTSLCCKAIQELSQKVEELENKLKEKEENNG